jgi:hypothetical protein
MGFETVVRPVVFPDIRPAPAQPQPPATTDPKSGIATIHGANGKFLDLAYSWSTSVSASRRTETKRRYDVARVYQKDKDGNVNKDNFVDINVANKIWLKAGEEDQIDYYRHVKGGPNIEIIEVAKIEINKPEIGGGS